jgi:hypothetical protein
MLADRAVRSADLELHMQCTCNASCRHQCIDLVGFTALSKLRFFVWYESSGQRKSRERHVKAKEELVSNAHRAYLAAPHKDDSPLDRFRFCVGQQRVCELSFQQIIGVIPAKSKHSWRGWSELKYKALGIEPPALPPAAASGPPAPPAASSSAPPAPAPPAATAPPGPPAPAPPAAAVASGSCGLY